MRVRRRRDQRLKAEDRTPFAIIRSDFLPFMEGYDEFRGTQTTRTPMQYTCVGIRKHIHTWEINFDPNTCQIGQVRHGGGLPRPCGGRGGGREAAEVAAPAALAMVSTSPAQHVHLEPCARRTRHNRSREWRQSSQHGLRRGGRRGTSSRRSRTGRPSTTRGGCPPSRPSGSVTEGGSPPTQTQLSGRSE